MKQNIMTQILDTQRVQESENTYSVWQMDRTGDRETDFVCARENVRDSTTDMHW